MRSVLVEEGLGSMPLVANLDFGHCDPVWPLPMGALIEVDVDRRTISFPEPAVTWYLGARSSVYRFPDTAVTTGWMVIFASHRMTALRGWLRG